uniref:Uncharacterized protein n=1 Tax=Oryza brachyantha TaxID=4533 RepID=J3LGB5_ORYBR
MWYGVASYFATANVGGVAKRFMRDASTTCKHESTRRSTDDPPGQQSGSCGSRLSTDVYTRAYLTASATVSILATSSPLQIQIKDLQEMGGNSAHEQKRWVPR